MRGNLWKIRKKNQFWSKIKIFKNAQNSLLTPRKTILNVISSNSDDGIWLPEEHLLKSWILHVHTCPFLCFQSQLESRKYWNKNKVYCIWVVEGSGSQSLHYATKLPTLLKSRKIVSLLEIWFVLWFLISIKICSLKKARERRCFHVMMIHAAAAAAAGIKTTVLPLRLISYKTQMNVNIKLKHSEIETTESCIISKQFLCIFF